jgi:hypothetical protein
MQPVNGRPAYAYVDDEQRKVARDAYVAWQGSRYSVPWESAGKEHDQAVRLHQVVTRGEHHEGIPLGVAQRSGKTLIHIEQSAPMVEQRPLAAYESLATGGVR